MNAEQSFRAKPRSESSKQSFKIQACYPRSGEEEEEKKEEEREEKEERIQPSYADDRKERDKEEEGRKKELKIARSHTLA